MQFCRWLLIVFACALLHACASPRLSQELQLGKWRFEHGDYKSAFCQLLPIAVYGKREAQYAVGYMYYYGFGTARNEESGIFWISRAAEQCYPPAIKALCLIRFPKPDCPTDRPCAVREDVLVRRPCAVPEDIVVRRPPCGIREDVIVRRPCSAPVRKPCFREEVPVREQAVFAPEPPPLLARPVIINESHNTKSSGKVTEQDEVLQAVSKQNSLTEKPKQLVEKTDAEPDNQPIADKNYTLQLFGAFNLENVKNLQKELGLHKNTRIWRSQNQGKDWYVLTYGNFDVVADARLANKKLPEEVKDLEPWVRKMDGLQAVG